MKLKTHVDQLSICLIRKEAGRSCRDCIYFNRCDPRMPGLEAADIRLEIAYKKIKEVNKNGNHKI